MSSTLTGKVAVVTGASKGIGAAIARHLGAAGAAVVVNYASSKEGAERVVGEITKNGGKAVAIRADVAKETDIRQLFADAVKTFGRLDILVNNAGIYDFQPLENITAEHFRRHFELNVLGLLLASKEAARHFGADGGAIINLSSVAATAGFANSAVYSATKGAVDSVTKVLASELAPRKIRVNGIAPGMVETEGFHASGIDESQFAKEAAAKIPLGRLGQPDDIGAAAAFLASPDSSWITGETLTVSGGV